MIFFSFTIPFFNLINNSGGDLKGKNLVTESKKL